jgi:hypothetical protein
MSDVREDWDIALKKLEQQRTVKEAKASKASDEFEEEEEDTDSYVASEELGKATDLLKRTALLLEFLSDSGFCKNITKRERELMLKHVEEINELTDELDEAVEAFEEVEEEDEDL